MKSSPYLKIFGISCLILSLFLFLLLISNLKTEKSYKIYLDGKEVSFFYKCDGEWNYSNIFFIPCVFEGNLSGVPQGYINWSLNPQENCIFWNGTFTGFNVLNDTIAQEKYDNMIPKCYEVNQTNIEVFIKTINYSKGSWRDGSLVIKKA